MKFRCEVICLRLGSLFRGGLGLDLGRLIDLGMRKCEIMFLVVLIVLFFESVFLGYDLLGFYLGFFGF